MNKLSWNVLEILVHRQVQEALERMDMSVLYELLDCTENSLTDTIVDMITEGKIKKPEEPIELSTIDELLSYANHKELDMTLGIDSIIESYIVSTLSLVLEMDLLEWI